MIARNRLRVSRDFSRVLRHGSSVARPEFVLYHLARDGQGPPRIGFSVSRKIGGAVVRNRTKRLLREAVRPLMPRVTLGRDLVIVARGAVHQTRLAEITASVEAAAAQAGLIHTSEHQEEGTST